WGKPLSITGSMKSTLGQYNPLRYRSYVYDRETGLYYLQSRYYNPTIGRFINADNQLSGVGGDVLGYNLFAYCGNNPVIRADHGGQFWDYVIDAVFLAWSVYDVINEPEDWENWAALGVDAIFAVVPFVTSGAGQVIKIGNRVDDVVDVAGAINKIDNIQDVSKATMIGRDMQRVTKAAKNTKIIGLADNLYDAWKGYDKSATGIKKIFHNSISMAHNGGWLLGKLRKGYTVIDIGVTTAHRGRKTFGLWYGTERAVLSIWQTRNIWKLPINYYS
ncbi:MAG: RHS repeat-associated core domain-containing protein, partial [Oscillospiraceae bacterium]|nr:RHS repeat-associated core domain-containing protein [Oscillospiraceae bacterium]